MLALDYEKRPTVNEVMTHPWMKGTVPTSLEVFSEFQRRQEQIQRAKIQNTVPKTIGCKWL